MSNKEIKSPPIRLVRKSGQISVVRLGFRNGFASDYFHMFLRRGWPTLICLLVLFVTVSNALFAGVYLLMGDAIINAQHGSFWDAFFFSVQTMATVGYGQMSPHGLVANMVASAEAIYGLLTFAIIAGLVFAKFSKPTSKIVFSNVAVITKRDGNDVLMFRMVNERQNQILDGILTVSMMETIKTSEGETLRMFRDIKMVRGRTPIFALTFTAVHNIDEVSPFYKADLSTLRDKQIELIVTFSGVDEVFSQNIYARHSYTLDEILWRHRFVDILGILPDGRRSIDFSKFHDAVPT